MEILFAWLSANWADLIKDLVLTTISVIVGYRLSVQWSRREAKEAQRAEKESLMRNIAFLINDCRCAIRDAKENIGKSLPPYRALPCSGIEHFQEHLMRYGENELFVAVSTLRSVIEQANFLMPTMAQEFVALSTDEEGRAVRLRMLNAFYAETMKRFLDIEQHCFALGAKLEVRLLQLKK
jgi:hypothetical protein